MLGHKFEDWLKAASLRAVKTAAEAALGVIGSSVALGGVDWKLVVSSSILSVIVSYLISVKGLPEVELQGKIDRMKIGEQEGIK